MINDALHQVLDRLHNVRHNNGSAMAKCPAHEDGTASLSIRAGVKQPVVLHCHAGCMPEDILGAVGLTFADLSGPREENRTADAEWTPAGPAVAIYDYRDERGELLFQVVRAEGKKFFQRRPDVTAKSGWKWQLGDTRRVLYRLPRIIEAVEQCREIYIVEGEKDVHTLEGQGFTATCNPGGAGKWLPGYTETLRDAVVTIIQDRDEPGEKHARLVVEALTGVAASICVKQPALGKDATDHFAAGGGLDDLEDVWTSEPAPAPRLAPDLWEFLDQTDEPFDWVIPDLLERGDRLILTGFEGLGKSMLTRQLAVCAAAGIDPFRHEHRFPPARVLFIDCENSERQTRRKLRPIAQVTRDFKQPAPHGGMRLIHRPEGLDLASAADAEWLYGTVTAYMPELLLIGPFYKLHDANMDEVVARRVTVVLDKARAISNCALITEAHAGHGDNRDRSVRPTGSSLLMRWPEFGYGLAPAPMAAVVNGRCTEVDFVSWRGARDDRSWPTHLRHGQRGYMPWEPYKPTAKTDKGATK